MSEYKTEQGRRIAASRALNSAFARAEQPPGMRTDAPYQGTLPHDGPTPARLHLATRDRKLAPVSKQPYKSPTSRRTFRPIAAGPYCCATYVSISATCPDICAFKNAGCYVTEGFTARANNVLDKAAADLDADEVIDIEASLIEQAFSQVGHRVPQDGARGGRDLRLHIGGDVGSEWGARRLAEAAMSWRQRRGGNVWTFTHRWREIYASAWGIISALASVESPEEAAEARRQEYVPAIVVDTFPSEKSFRIDGSDVSWIPCPAETRGRTCVECRLCLNVDRLYKRNQGIAFQAHGKGARKVRRRLAVINGDVD